MAVCPNKVKGATTVNVSWNYSESAGSAVAAALDADVSISIFTILLSSIFSIKLFVQYLIIDSLFRFLGK